MADGDSITAGTGGVTPYPSSFTLTNPANVWNVYNVAISSELLSEMLTNAPTRVDPLYRSKAPKNVSVIWGGTNDIVLGSTPASVYANMQSYCAARQAVGWKCVAVTMISRTGFDTQKNTLNGLLMADHSWADGFVDLSGTLLGCDGCSTDSTYFQAGGVHPTQFAITNVEVPAFNTIVNGLP